ncbi:MAG: hypothetical protein ABW061_16550 [Polyangiaceae bacterium]
MAGFCGALLSLGCADHVPELGGIDSGCIAQLTGASGDVLLAQRTDSTLWVAQSGGQFSRVDGPDGPLSADESAASGSSAQGTARGCAVVSGSAWCFPLTDPLLASSQSQVLTGPSADAPPLTGVTQFAGGTDDGGATFCAVTSDGKIWCWSDDPNGLLIHGENSSAAQPVLLDPNTEFSAAVEVRVGFDSACARRSDGSVWCWGNDQYGQLGTPAASAAARSVYPVQVALPGAASRLAASPGNTQCAILDDTRVVCWGRNEFAEAGASSETLVIPPTIVQTQRGGPAFSGVVDLAPDRGMRAMCANTKNAGLWCWGDVLSEATAAVGSPYPIQLATSPQGRISVSLSAYGASSGKLIYVNANGRLVLGAGNMPSSRQPPCP